MRKLCTVCQEPFEGPEDEPFCSEGCYDRFIEMHAPLKYWPVRKQACKFCPYRRSTSGWVTTWAHETNKLRLSKGLKEGCHEDVYSGHQPCRRCVGQTLMDKDPAFLTTEEFMAMVPASVEACRKAYNLIQEEVSDE